MSFLDQLYQCGRLIPQIVYYYSAYLQLVNQGKLQAGQPVNFVVPTGNFGNILAAYYARQLGLPVHKLICASNANNVLFDFFTTGIYDKERPFFVTMSPSMDNSCFQQSGTFTTML